VATSSIKSSTQFHLDVEDVRDDLVIMKDGGCVLILQTTAVNFGLLSEKEQDAMIYAYGGMLNSLTFAIQIVIISAKKDISAYLKLLKNEEEKTQKPIFKEQIRLYYEFIKKIVAENEVLDKKFYIALPFSPLELGLKSAKSSLFGDKKTNLPLNYILEKAKNSLFPKRDHIVRQLSRIGLKSEQLKTQQLIELFYNTYNPEAIGTHSLVDTKEYTTPIVGANTTTGTISKS
jgi:hypothetical protein